MERDENLKRIDVLTSIGRCTCSAAQAAVNARRGAPGPRHLAFDCRMPHNTGKPTPLPAACCRPPALPRAVLSLLASSSRSGGIRSIGAQNKLHLHTFIQDRKLRTISRQISHVQVLGNGNVGSRSWPMFFLSLSLSLNAKKYSSWADGGPNPRVVHGPPWPPCGYATGRRLS